MALMLSYLAMQLHQDCQEEVVWTAAHLRSCTSLAYGNVTWNSHLCVLAVIYFFFFFSLVCHCNWSSSYELWEKVVACWWEMKVCNAGLQKHLLFRFWYFSGSYYIVTYSALPGQVVLGLCRGTFRHLSQPESSDSFKVRQKLSRSFKEQFWTLIFNYILFYFFSLALQWNLIKTVLKVFPHQQFHLQRYLQLWPQILSLFHVFLLYWQKEEFMFAVHK